MPKQVLNTFVCTKPGVYKGCKYSSYVYTQFAHTKGYIVAQKTYYNSKGKWFASTQWFCNQCVNCAHAGFCYGPTYCMGTYKWPCKQFLWVKHPKCIQIYGVNGPKQI
jgi:hypothetical protein